MGNKKKQIVALLPKTLQKKILMEYVEINHELDPKITFKIAETREELEEAFQLLYKAYIKVGLQKENESKMRVTPYHALDSTTTIVAKYEDKVVGTVSIIRDGSLGIPCDELVDFSKERQEGIRFAEISAFAIAPEFRGRIFWYLIKYMHNYAQKFFKIDSLIATIVSKNRAHLFYESILNFTPVQQTEFEKYNFSNDQKVIVEHLPLKQAEKDYRSDYSLLPKEKNLYYFFIDYQCPNFIFPDRQQYLTSDPVMNGENLKYFFYEKSKVYDEFPTELKAPLLEKMNLVTSIRPKRAQRTDVLLNSICKINNQSQQSKITNISSTGIRVHLSNLGDIAVGHIATFSIHLPTNKRLEVQGKICWIDDHQNAGISIESVEDSVWLEGYNSITAHPKGA